MKELRNRVAVVTGAASGIGLAVVRTLLARGAQVLATDLDDDALARASSRWDGAPVTRRLDVTSVDDWRAAIEAAKVSFGGVDVVYNIAGYLTPGWVHELDVR
ncbi:MAG: SDR family oxidoreductase, partial [Alphaproteobacteria bacterium]